MPTDNHRPVAVVCAALGLEYQAILEHLETPPIERDERGSLYQLGDFEHWCVVATHIGRDNTPAAVQVERAITLFNPAVVLLVGIAGGRRKVRHGDVVAADSVYDYQAGRDTDETTLGRVKSLAASFPLVQRAKAVASQNRWRDRIVLPLDRPPEAHVGPLAAGGRVVTSAESHTARLIDRHCDDALGIETEGFGVMAAAHANPSVSAMVIRGISDLLDDKAFAADRHWQPVAARHACAFAFELLHHTRPDQPVARTAPGEQRPASTYIVAQGDNAVANVAAVGDHSRGELHIHRLTTRPRIAAAVRILAARRRSGGPGRDCQRHGLSVPAPGGEACRTVLAPKGYGSRHVA